MEGLTGDLTTQNETPGDNMNLEDSEEVKDVGIKNTPSESQHERNLRPANLSKSLSFDDSLSDVDKNDEEPKPQPTTNFGGFWYTDEAQLSYISLCSNAGTVPSGYFLRNMNNKTLTLSSCAYGAIRMKPILASIGVNTTITTLDISDANLGDESIPDLCNMFKENYTIKDINLASNQFTSQYAENLCDVLASSAQLERIDLHGNKFCDKAAIFFSELMATSLNMTYLNLAYNDFGEIAIVLFGRALPQATSLVELDLSWNRLGSGAMRPFAKGLAENKNIQKLNLSSNGIGPSKGCRELAIALRGNKSVLELDLSGNRISPEGAVLLSKGLFTNTTLEKLNLTRNPLQTAGCYAILRVVLRNANSGLLELDLQGIPVNDDFRQLQDSARLQRPKMVVRAGVVSTEKTRALSSKWLEAELSPKEILQRMGKIANQSLLDALQQIDTSGEKRITREAFIPVIHNYLTKLGIDFTEEQMKQLMSELDPKKEEEIHFDLLGQELKQQ